VRTYRKALQIDHVTYEYISSHFSFVSVCGVPVTSDARGGCVSLHTFSKLTCSKQKKI
jgi:hypothetical protein